MDIKNSIDYTWKDDKYETPAINKDLKRILKKIKGLENLSYLDVGCGNGSITKKISNFFKNTTGIDLSYAGIEQAKKANTKEIDFLHLSLEGMIEKKKKFNFVSAIEVIEHQYDPYLFVEQLSKVTEDNGFVLISTPYHGYFKNLLISILGKMDRHFTVLWRHGHIKFFSIKTLKELILGESSIYKKNNPKFNFEIVKIYFSGRFFPLSHSMIFLLKKTSQ